MSGMTSGGKRVAIVSGGTSGIGRAVAFRLARDGFAVVAFGDDWNQVEELRADSLASDLGIELEIADVADRAQVEALVAAVLSRHGRIDVLCNVAAVKHQGTILETDEETWDRTFDVNVKGTFLLTKTVLPALIAQGKSSIVNIGSQSGYGGTGHVAYAATKGAIHALGTSLALDLLADGVRVNTVVPGSTRTGMNCGRPASVESELARLNVAGRINEPEDVAAAVSFLVSDAAATISGARFEVGAVSGQLILPAHSVTDEQ